MIKYYLTRLISLPFFVVAMVFIVWFFIFTPKRFFARIFGLVTLIPLTIIGFYVIYDAGPHPMIIINLKKASDLNTYMEAMEKGRIY